MNGRTFGRCLLVMLVSAGAVRAVGWSVAQDLAYLDPPSALGVWANQPMALGSVAELEWALGRHERAIPLARRAAAANPMNGAGYRVLALVAVAKGDDARAAELMRLALRRTPGDATARRWLADRAQAEGRWQEALALQDRLLRQAPEDGVAWFAEWTRLLPQPAVRAAMVPVLGAKPLWREAFLAYYAANAPVPADVDALFGEMRRLSPGETTMWISRLVADGRWREAYSRWQRAVDAAGVVAGVVNGGFETAPGLAPFDWTLQAPPGVQVVRAVATGRPGMALRLQFLGSRAAFAGVHQAVPVAPGHHRLNWAYRLEALNTPRGLRWVVACAGTDGKAAGPALGASPLMAGESVWREAGFDFEVPVGCAAVALRLELAARIPAETRAYGTAWIDDVRLDG